MEGIENDILKSLGFTKQHKWVLYDDSFQKFFSWFSENIAQENILRDVDLFERRKLENDGAILEENDLNDRLKELNRQYPRILEVSDEDLDKAREEVAEIIEADKLYSEMVSDAMETVSDLSRDITDLEKELGLLENAVEKIGPVCKEKGKLLQQHQKDNKESFDDVNKCYVKMQNPPLFMHQMAFDQYGSKFDFFYQYLKLYLKDNFKIQEEINEELRYSNEIDGTIKQLVQIKNQIVSAYRVFITNRSKTFAMKKVQETFDVNRFHFTDLDQIKKDTADMEKINRATREIHFKSITADCLASIKKVADVHTEKILLENNKQKYQRAKNNRMKIQQVYEITTSLVNNYELMWILLQIDLEKSRTRIENNEQFIQEYNMLTKRKSYRNFSPNENILEIFLQKFADELSQSVPNQKFNTIKQCLYEYEKLSRPTKFILQNILNKRYYDQIIEVNSKLTGTIDILRPFMYDSPVNEPLLCYAKFLGPIYKANATKQDIQKVLKELRTEFQENISERWNSDRLWKMRQNFWIWFLTEPKKVLQAIAEANKKASNVPNSTHKSLAGLKRK